MNNTELEQYIYRHIPITQQMEISVTQLDATGITLTAPIAPNINDKGTAFAGSINTLAVLSGWALIQNRIVEEHIAATIVATQNTVRFVHPICHRLEVFCPSPSPETWAAFLDTLRGKGKTRLELSATFSESGQTCVNFEGRYAATIKQ